MLFKDVIGHSRTKAALRQIVAEERIPHTQLFLGRSGTGTLPMALAFAQYILCQNPQSDDACGACPACSKVQKHIHPDVHYSFPTIGSKVTSDHFLSQWRKGLLENPYMNYQDWLQHIQAENKQGNINKDECINIIKKMSLKTFEADYKILILWLPELLGKEGNRLLKLIEEPPENTLFVLVAQNQDAILNTILSRCQITHFPLLQDNEVALGLAEKQDIDAQTAQQIAQLAAGDFGEAIHLATQESNEYAPLFLDWMRCCYKGNAAEMVAWSETFATLGRESQKYFMEYALHFMREYMVLKITGNEARVRLMPKEKQTAQNLTKVIGIAQLERISHLLTDTAYYVERNANAKLLALDASIQMHHFLKKEQPALN